MSKASSYAVWSSGFQKGKKDEREAIYSYFFSQEEKDDTKIYEGLRKVLDIYRSHKGDDDG